MVLIFQVVILLSGLLLRCLISLNDYSGKGANPMYGDYEAQRHWMEITVNLPVHDWYFDTKENDLDYWGLDYPPLTAYHSALLGYIARFINPDWVKLFESRGYESPQHKQFMRYTVLFSDLVTFIAAAYLYNKFTPTVGRLSGTPELILLLFYPGFILIDHGHFQYNCVSLALALISFLAFLKGYNVLGSVSFSLALNYKQMSLYYSLPVFFYLLGKCKNTLKIFGFKSSLYEFIKLALAVIFTFIIVWAPFIFNKEQIAQLIHRIFPLKRGVFEDKVSNFWCLVNVFVKFRLFITNERMALICAILTFISCLPSCANVFLKPKPKLFLLSLFNCSLSFFLFSFQVHEKTILLVALPAILCFKIEPLMCFWFLNVSTISMFPLFVKDNLIFPFFIMFFIFNIIVYSIFKSAKLVLNQIWLYPFIISMLSNVILLVSSFIITPPKKYPDLFPVLISVISAAHFLFFLVYFNLRQLKIK